jgi:hypothetical protein
VAKKEVARAEEEARGGEEAREEEVLAGDGEEMHQAASALLRLALGALRV